MKNNTKSKNQGGSANNNYRNPTKGHPSSANPLNPHNNNAKAPELRRQVDPETAKYFAEIANLFESNEVDPEDYSTICGNALEETRGREVELATDPVVSHTLQRLLEGCDLDQLNEFIRNCSKGFPLIAVDMFGSHVAETAFKSLAVRLEDEGSYSIIEDTLRLICREMVGDSVKVMCSCYGSHVLRSLLCLCKGVPLDSIKEFHGAKRSTALAGRLNFKSGQSGGNDQENFQHGFNDVFKFLVREMLNHAKDEMKTLRVDRYSSFVLQTTLRLLVGDDDELLRAILILLRCHKKDNESKFTETVVKQDIMDLLEDTASSHLLEVVIEVAPETMYNQLLNEVFKGSFYEISSHPCGNFVVQALISSARTRDQAELIWDELGAKLKELLEVGKSGVVASILAACQRLQTHANECCQALAAAVSEPESSSRIVPHILFLDSYFREKSSWKWPIGDKMHLLGCLMLQTIFKYPNHIIQPYITSITSMEDDQIYQTAKDSGGSHVLEAILDSDVSAKGKLKIITMLRDHFGELSMLPSSSFTVEKCFSASNLYLKETIATELLAVQSTLTKTKHGPYLLKKLDIDGFARNPEQWKLTQTSKQTVYKEFQAIFGSGSKLQKQEIQAPQSSQKSNKRKRKSDETAPAVEISTGKKVFLAYSRKSFVRNSKESTFLRGGKRKYSDSSSVRKPGKRKSAAAELADLASKSRLSAGDVHKLFRTPKCTESGNEPRPFLKKQKR